MAVVGVAGLLLGPSCLRRGPAQPGSGEGSLSQTQIPARVELREVRQHPRISLVERLGDPAAAVAFAVAHDLGSVASTALGALCEVRLERTGIPGAVSRPHELGFEVRALVNSPAEAPTFVRAATAVLAQPVTPGEPGVGAAEERVKALFARSWAGAVDATLGRCSGELGMMSRARDSESARELPLEAWRKQVYSANAVAFAALGGRQLLDSASEALAETDPWPDDPAVRDPWPSDDFVGVDDASGSKRLGVALRVEDGGLAVEASRLLGQKNSALAARLGALGLDWKLVRVVATNRPRGACLRLDLEASRDAVPSVDDVGRAAHLVLDEARLALLGKPAPGFALEQSVLGMSDPREAAGVAAWLSLAGRLPPGPRRKLVGYQGTLPGARPGELDRQLAALSSSAHKSTLGVVSRVEPGQGDVWLLLASPCGTYGEVAAIAGSEALMVRALAEKKAETGTVLLEPWVTPDGVGFLAHGPRLGPEETAEAQARRVASTLGRVLVGTVLTSSDVASARTLLLGELGAEPRPGYWAALDLARPGRPSWLEPRGTWRSLVDLESDAVEARRRAFLGAPLRLAVLANWNTQQVTAAQAGLERWFGGLRTGGERCASLGASMPKSGRAVVETKENTQGPAAYLVVSLPDGLATSRREAEWTSYLLGRPRGWLERTFSARAGTVTATARLLGGRRAAALVIEIYTGEDQADAAVAQVRALIEHLGRGNVDARDAEVARRAFGGWETESLIEPRRRLVDLWYGTRPSPADLASLRRFCQRAFASPAVGVVLVKNRG
jgi:hypothetical protein